MDCLDNMMELAKSICNEGLVLCLVYPNHCVSDRLSQSPSLLISGSGSWPSELSALALSLAITAAKIKNPPLALRAREKI